MSPTKGRTGKGLLLLTPLPAGVLLIVLFFVPLLYTTGGAFIVDGRFSLKRIALILSDPYSLSVIGFTFRQALVSTLFSVAAGLPGAWLIGNCDFPGRRILKSVCMIPFVLPPILLVLGFVIFYGNNGYLNRALMALFGLSQPPLRILYSYWAIIAAHTFYNFPVVMSLTGSAWEQMDRSCEMASRTLGAGRFRTFVSVTLPRLLPAVLSSALLVFLFCFTSFAVVLVLGGGPRFTTIEVEIYNQARRLMNTDQAAALALVSLFVCIVVVITDIMLQKPVEGLRPAGDRRSAGKGKAWALVYALLLGFFVLAPLVSVVVRSFVGSATRAGEKHFSIEQYRGLFSGSVGQALAGSLIIAASVCIVALFCSLSLCVYLRRRKSGFLETVAMFPMAVSSIIVGLGYYTVSRLLGNISAHVLIVLAHTVLVIPFAIRTILPVYRALPQSLINSSRTLGCTPAGTFFRVELPLLRPILLTAGAFAFAISFGEMNATMMLSTGTVQTLPVLIYRLTDSYNYQGACALGSVLMLVCFGVFALGQASRRESTARASEEKK
ncbi:MAG: iron ABC transporter permease [Spirochaetales bacterium]|nr:iron ABC transporter permease [Spirochaetales bacterium]